MAMLHSKESEYIDGLGANLLEFEICMEQVFLKRDSLPVKEGWKNGLTVGVSVLTVEDMPLMLFNLR